MASKVSMNRNTNTNGSIAGDSAWNRSICKNVGASDGGADTRPLANSNRCTSIEPVTTGDAATASGSCGKTSFKPTVSAVAEAMPQRIEPRTRRANSTAVTSRPVKNTIRSGDVKCAFSFTAVPGSLTIKPAFCRPMKAMNRPMPAAMPFLRLGLTALKINSRRPTSERIRNSTPEINTAPSATCQPLAKPAAVAAGMAEKTKKKFSPMPGAWAMG